MHPAHPSSQHHITYEIIMCMHARCVQAYSETVALDELRAEAVLCATKSAA